MLKKLLCSQVHRRSEDGIHWDMTAHRLISNLLLTHLSEAWGLDLPGNSSKASELETQSEVKVKKGPGSSNPGSQGFQPKKKKGKCKKKVAPVASLQQIPPQAFGSAECCSFEFPDDPVQQMLEDSWRQNNWHFPVFSNQAWANDPTEECPLGMEMPAVDYHWQPPHQQAPMTTVNPYRGHEGELAGPNDAGALYTDFCQAPYQDCGEHELTPEANFHSTWMQTHHAELHEMCYKPRNFYRYHPY